MMQMLEYEKMDMELTIEQLHRQIEQAKRYIQELKGERLVETLEGDLPTETQFMEDLHLELNVKENMNSSLKEENYQLRKSNEELIAQVNALNEQKMQEQQEKLIAIAEITKTVELNEEISETVLERTQDLNAHPDEIRQAVNDCIGAIIETIEEKEQILNELSAMTRKLDDQIADRHSLVEELEEEIKCLTEAGPSRMADSPLHIKHAAQFALTHPFISKKPRLATYTDYSLSSGSESQSSIEFPEPEVGEPAIWENCLDLILNKDPIEDLIPRKDPIEYLKRNFRRVWKHIPRVPTYDEPPAVTPSSVRRHCAFTPTGIFKRRHYNRRRIYKPNEYQSPNLPWGPLDIPSVRSPLPRLISPENRIVPSLLDTILYEDGSRSPRGVPIAPVTHITSKRSPSHLIKGPPYGIPDNHISESIGSGSFDIDSFDSEKSLYQTALDRNSPDNETSFYRTAFDRNLVDSETWF